MFLKHYTYIPILPIKFLSFIYLIIRSIWNFLTLKYVFILKDYFMM